MNPLRLIFRKQAARALTCLLALALLGLSPAAAIEIVRTSPYGATEPNLRNSQFLAAATAGCWSASC